MENVKSILLIRLKSIGDVLLTLPAVSVVRQNFPAAKITFLTSRENALTRIQEMIVTPDMHERKRLMFERSDAFVALPGGIGTLEELVEQMTWQQLGRHTKPVLLANIDGFWEPLLVLLAHMRATEFIRPTLPIEILKAERVEDILPRLRAAAARAQEGTEKLAPEIARRL